MSLAVLHCPVASHLLHSPTIYRFVIKAQGKAGERKPMAEGKDYGMGEAAVPSANPVRSTMPALPLGSQRTE